MKARALGLLTIALVFVGLGLAWVGRSDAPEPAVRAAAPVVGPSADAPAASTADPDPAAIATRGRATDSLWLVDRLGRALERAREPTPEQARMAGRLIALFNDFDLEAAAEVYEHPTIGTEEWFVWLRGRVGKCGDARPLAVRDDDRVRYLYTCEQGQLEAEFRINPETGKLPALIMGARGVELDDAVHEAAEAVVSLMRRWDLALFHRTFNDKFEAEKMRRFFLDLSADRGACRLGETDLASARGVLIGLVCERASRLMKIELGKDDRIRTFWIRDPRPTN